MERVTRILRLRIPAIRIGGFSFGFPHWIYAFFLVQVVWNQIRYALGAQNPALFYFFGIADSPRTSFLLSHQAPLSYLGGWLVILIIYLIQRRDGNRSWVWKLAWAIPILWMLGLFTPFPKG